MRKKILTLMTMLVLTGSTLMLGQTAKVQIIHNSADQAAEYVDIYLNGGKLLNDFPFRNATSFIDAPADVVLDIGIAPQNSTGVEDTLYNAEVTFASGETYVVVANGMISHSGYNPAPAFDLYVFNMGQMEAASEGNTDVLVFHGATDAPTVDVGEPNAQLKLVDDMDYGAFNGSYLNLATADYSLQVQNEFGSEAVAQYGAPLETLGLEDSALVVLASGFLNPANNSDGPAFGLYAALPAGGELVELPGEDIATANVQVIHNAADKAAAAVDIYLNDKLLLDDFTFRSASPFVPVTAGTQFDIAVQPSSSTDTAGALARFSYQLAPDENYILTASGIVSSSGYDPDKPFEIKVLSGARTEASQSGNTDVMVFHGATDAPVVDIYESSVPAGTLVDNLAYGMYADSYLELATDNYSIDIQDESGATTVASFQASLADLGLEDSSLVVLASGFLNPDDNDGGEAFGLYAALPAGGDLIALPAIVTETAMVQVIHNSADQAAEMVDVYLDDEILIDDFTFRNATPFVELPAGVDIDITIQPQNSSDTTNGLFRKSYNLTPEHHYVLVANGIVSGSGYAPAKPFDIYAYDMGQMEAASEGNTDVLVFHGATDAPTVDVGEPNAQLKLVDDMDYGAFNGSYLNLATADYSLQVQNEFGSEAVAQYGAPLETLGLEDSALVVLASGFLNPANNSDGPAFGLYAALPAGGELVELPGEDIATANVQVIHNAADKAAAAVDIYLNDKLLLDDFTFRSASPFVPVTAGTQFDIAVQPSSSTDTAGALARFSYQLAPDENYILTASGIVSSSGYDPDKPFEIKVLSGARTEASQSGNTDVMVFHGATDAPVVDIYESSVPAGTLVDNLAYGMYADSYLELATDNYSIDIQDESGATTVASFQASLADLGLEDSSLVVLASGFLNPDDNDGGEAFGLYAALPAGGDLIALPASEPTAIENSLAASAQMEVYPNPVSNILTIDIRNGAQMPLGIEIYNIMGQKISGEFDRQMINGNRIIRFDVGKLTEGIYFIVLTNGTDRITEKIKVIK